MARAHEFQPGVADAAGLPVETSIAFEERARCGGLVRRPGPRNPASPHRVSGGSHREVEGN